MRDRLAYLWNLRTKWPVLALCAFYFYLAFHALSGNQGVMRWVDYEADIKTSRAELSALKETRAALEARADSLRSNPLILDSLDIKARETLFNSHPNELTIWLDPTP
jgi:cell division protein FtsB